MAAFRPSHRPAVARMTHYVPIYDVEWTADVEVSLAALGAVVAVHRRRGARATFCIVGRLLELAPERYRALLSDDLFEVQNHSYSHIAVKQVVGAPPVDLEQVEDEVTRTNALIADALGVEPIGFRTPGGFTNGLQGQREVLGILQRAGMKWVSSDARGPAETVPAGFRQPYWYADDGFPDLLEIPGHTWHENVLKGYNPVTALWPPILPYGFPNRPPQTPEEEAAVHRQGMEHAVEKGLLYFSPPMHPWSLYRFNAEAKTVDLVLQDAERLGMPTATASEVYRVILEQRG